MTELHLPWLQLAILTPLLGAAWVARGRTADSTHRRAVVLSGVTLLLAAAEALDFAWIHDFEVHEHWDLTRLAVSWEGLTVDALSAPLIPLAALIYWVTILATPREKARRFTFPGALVGESLALATLSCRTPVVVAALLALGVLPPWTELRARERATRIYLGHAAVFVVLLVSGCVLLDSGSPSDTGAQVGVVLLSVACLLRAGAPPFHSWVMEFFGRASFGGALLFVAPMLGVYGVMRLCAPFAPEWLLDTIAVVSLGGAFYAAGLALIQNEPRRFFAALALSQSSIVLVGLDVGTLVGTAGALSVWLSAGLSLTGLGLVLRAVEARIGRFSMGRFLGLYNEVPTLASLFLLTGLALVGFPGTMGFVGVELLVEGSAAAYPAVGLVIVLVSAVNGIAVMRAYFRTFTGTVRPATPLLRIRQRERIAVLLISGLIIAGGLFPQIGVSSRYRAAVDLGQERRNAASRHEQSSEEAARRKHHGTSVAGRQRSLAVFESRRSSPN